MKRLQIALAATLLAAALVPEAVMSAQGVARGANRLRWERIVGIVQPGGIVGRRLPGGSACDVGVDCVEGSAAPWTVTDGSAEVDLRDGNVAFTVKGLVVAADPSFTNLGTPGVVTMVKGTLVCNDTEPGVPELVDTDAVALSARGDARFRGRVELPASCIVEPEDIVFLIRMADVSDPAAAFLIDLWNAFGAVRTNVPRSTP